MLIQQNVISFIIIVIVSVEYLNECDGYHLIPSTFNNNLIRFKRQAECRGRQFICDNGECIPINNFCDGKLDCSDESDEEVNCNTNGCSSKKFECAYGACIDADLKCDGKRDCRDNSDENPKTCYPNHCTVPAIENGKLTIAGVDCTPGSLINESSVISIDCDYDYILSVKDLPNCVAGIWDIDIPKCVPDPKECPAPEIENGKYEIVGNPQYVPGDPIPNFSVLNFTCIEGTVEAIYVLTTPYNLVNCTNGKFDSEIPRCVQSCYVGLAPTTTITTCTYNGVEIDCSKYVPRFTLVTIECKPNYVEDILRPARIACLNGLWSAHRRKCFPESCATNFSNSTNVECELNGLKFNCSKKVPEGTVARMVCKEDYVDSAGGPSIAICSNGFWDVPPKQCFPASCNTISSTVSTDVTCELNGIKQDCSKKVAEGTIATMQCRPHYVKLNSDPWTATCIRGTWDRPLEECVPDCGELGVSGSINRKSDFPWHVAMYSKRSFSKKLRFLCGGSIISEKVVLSAAKCFTTFKNGTLFPLFDFYVAAGKFFSDWEAPQDANSVQKRRVSKIEIPKEYMGRDSHYAPDIAVVFLEEPLVFTNFIKPVCVDWNSEYDCLHLQVGEMGKVPGWGPLIKDEPIPRLILKQLTLPNVDSNQCSENVPNYFKTYITEKTYCAGYANGTNICDGDNGGGMVFQHEETKKYYIQGIASLVPLVHSDLTCDFNKFGLFTKVNKYMSFIKNVTASTGKIYEDLKSKECNPPVIKNGFVKVISGDDFILQTPTSNFLVVNISCVNSNYKLSTPHTLIYCVEGKYSHEIPKCVLTCTPNFPISIDVNCTLNGIQQDCRKDVLEGTVAHMKCKPDYIDKNPEISKTTCGGNGTWDLPPKECASPYTCPPRLSNKIDVFCDLNGVKQDCNKEVPDGTTAYMKCKKNYVKASTRPPVTFCVNGNWKLPPLICIPDCSQIHQEGQTYIVNGTSANRDEFPWHVAIYKKKPQGLVDYICGGSIISVKIVVTAAHCVTDANNGDLYPVSEFKVAAGKKYSKWDAPEDEYYVQKRNVVKMHTPRDIFFGQLSSYAGDVAVVVVDKIFTFTNFIKPICVDWSLKYINQQLKDGNLGKIAGFGADTTGNQIASVNLKQLTIPYVRRDLCVEIVPKNFISYVTVDKFCAGYTNGSSVCGGDSGGGIAFPDRNQNGGKTYFLQGIVSAGPSVDGHCDTHQLGVYTKISNYISFIRDVEESNRV